MSSHACEDKSEDCLQESIELAAKLLNLTSNRNRQVVVVISAVDCREAVFDDQHYEPTLLKRILILMIESAEDFLEVVQRIVQLNPLLVIFVSLSNPQHPPPPSHLHPMAKYALSLALISEEKISFTYVGPSDSKTSVYQEFFFKWIS